MGLCSFFPKYFVIVPEFYKDVPANPHAEPQRESWSYEFFITHCPCVTFLNCGGDFFAYQRPDDLRGVLVSDFGFGTQPCGENIVQNDNFVPVLHEKNVLPLPDTADGLFVHSSSRASYSSSVII
jgi:hypothetical protein